MYFPDLIEEYKQSLSELRAMGGNLDMQRDLMEAIKWMETGYDPAEYRAATRVDAFVMDHHLMQDLISYVDSDEFLPDLLAEDIDKCEDSSAAREIERLYRMKKDVGQAMAGLTDNERAVFILIRAEYMTFSRVAKTLGVSKSSVQSYLERAEGKIQNNLKFGSQVELDLFAV